MIWILAAVALSCSVSTVLTVLLSVRALQRERRKYGRLLAKYVVSEARGKDERGPEIPSWAARGKPKRDRNLKRIK